ncbi:MAG: BlaI/MecI/CopY family transcriptional regulator [Clostridia bacterium]|nr:BlaI/MecI/CopY family transcriptional regulator [Clostridia bacterium]
MDELKLGMVESRFAELVWAHAPMTTRTLVELCQQELNWKRTTTYTVLKKLCDRGLFAAENGTVTVRRTKEEFYAMQSEKFVADTFSGSLPAFIAAFTRQKKLTADEIAEIRQIIDRFDKE